jgi:hypothetical protein
MKRPNYIRLDYPVLSKKIRQDLEKYEFDMKKVYLALYRIFTDSDFDDDYYEIFEDKAKEYALEPRTHDYRDVLFLGRDLFIEVTNSMRIPLQTHLHRTFTIDDVLLEPTTLYLIVTYA